MPIPDALGWALLLRAVLTACFVIGVTRVAERLGPFWGGLLVSLPISAGPAYVMLSLDHDGAFISASALGSLAVNPMTLVFILVIVRLAPIWPWPAVIPTAVAVWLAAAYPVRMVDWTLGPVLAANAVVAALCLFLSRDARRAVIPAGGVARPRWYEMPLRGAMVGVLVAVVVTASDWMGPVATGMAAVFPIMLTGLALLVLPRLGGVAAASLFAGALRSMLGFALFLLMLHLLAAPLGAWAGLGLSLLTQLGFSAVLALTRRR